MLYQSVSFSDFVDAFRAHDRQGQFSYEAKRELFDFFEEAYEGEMYELDVIAICCDFTEASADEIRQTYYEAKNIEDDDDLFDWLSDQTLMMRVNDGAVYQNF